MGLNKVSTEIVVNLVDQTNHKEYAYTFKLNTVSASELWSKIQNIIENHIEDEK